MKSGAGSLSQPSWVASLALADAGALGELRLVPGLEVANCGDVLWLRGPEQDEALTRALRKIPGRCEFQLLAGGGLLKNGNRIPEGRLPALSWQPLREFFQVRMPAAMTEHRPPGAELTLIRSAVEEPAGALLCDPAAWVRWATQASELRLRPLRFAAARDGRVWILGVPVASIEGPRFYVREGIAAPCGFAWQPALEPKVLRRWLGLATGDIAFAAADGIWEIIKEEQFVAATRSAARLTAEALDHG